MTYDGTITTSYPDPNLILTATLKDGTLLHVLHDEDPQSPAEWDEPASLVLTDGDLLRTCRVGRPTSNLHHALLYAAGNWRHEYGAEEKVMRYMRLFHDVDVLPVGLYGSSQWAEGYMVLDNLAKTHGHDYELKPGEAKAILKCCAREWEAYWSGDVFGFIHTDAEGEEIDSCFGFYLNRGDDAEAFARSLCYGHVEGAVVDVEWR